MITTKKKILIDTDLGDDVDDAAAVMMALHSAEFDIIGITTVFQNTEKRAEMVLELCEKCGRKDIPVYAGCAKPLIERPVYEENPIQYAILEKKRQLDQSISAVDFMIQSVRENPDITIVEMGAMTNLAMAFYKEPKVMEKAKIIAMGGIFTQSLPEWNMECDPEAARIVLDYAKNLTMFGLEVTKYCTLTEDMRQALYKKNEQMDYFFRGVKIFCDKTGYPVTLHDALLIAYLIEPDIVELIQSDYTIELAGKITRGGIARTGNMYSIETEVNKEFYFAKSMKIEAFQRIVIDRIS
ncbi:nucleoside hydrolase [Lachnospiraceae bacterium ZAX-1]